MVKNKTINNKKEICMSQDGIFRINNYKETLSSDFKNEKELVKFIVCHIDDFTKILFNDSVISFETEYEIDKRHKLSPRGRRVDIFISGVKSKYLIETKCPKFGTESRAAIGQVLDYGKEFCDENVELVIVTTNFDIDTAKTIKYYNLPIRYIYLSKVNFVEYLSMEGENGKNTNQNKQLNR